MDKTISITNLSFKYLRSEEYALKNINLEVEKGEFIGLVGKSGCGKSTILYHLNGIIPHAVNGVMEGKVEVCGLDTAKHEISELATHVGMVFQNPEVQLFSVTVEDEVAFVAENLNYPVEKIKECLDFSLDAVGITDLRERYPFELSGGEKQRVAIASAISVKPEVLLLDEPTSELDSQGREMVLEVVHQLNQAGMTIILAEHHLDDVTPYLDRLILMDKGRIIAGDTPQNIFKNRLFENIGLRPPQTVEMGLKLGVSTLPLSVDDAMDAFRKFPIKAFPLEIFNYGLQIEKMVEIKDLSFQYGDKKALHDINLSINKGEMMGLLGANGSGKTTLALLLMGLLKPSQGSVSVGGFNPEKQRKELVNIAGFLFQNPEHQLFCDSVHSELVYGFEGSEAVVDEIISIMGLDKFRNEHPLTLSRGERQRVATATALVKKPEILVIDEPTTGQDWYHVSSFMNLVKRLNQEGVTIILITHDMRVAAEYCQRLVVMKNGSIIMDGDTRNVFAELDLLKKAGLKPAPITEISLKTGIKPPLLGLKEINVGE
ncbi:ABC transporter ATP-binding protein [Methanobacterium ferruginis]|uniref:ABC transporter ATP-binding protein n=1 Tax=Methanobacterium ferruginis TaxID=710191 RepID=UPI002572F0F3|nr:ABC transporter ATP-binding protein [Methanobacterium ferruginis]BDZ68088.1 cobalt ABC transporter ATP-binding protein [Methanobacterium ferruginis]